MNDLNKHLEQMAELQKKNLEPMMAINGVAAQAFERLARQNYALMGDIMEYAVTQVNIPAGKSDPQGVMEEQVAEAQAFAEKVNQRASEYMDLVSELGDMMSSHVAGPMETVFEQNMQSAQALANASIEEMQAAADGLQGQTGTAKKPASKAAATRKPVAREIPAESTTSKAAAGKKPAAGKKTAGKKRSSKAAS